MFVSPTLPSTGPSVRRDAVIVGGGPAGLSVLLAASRTGSLTRLAEEGLTVVERGPSLGAGALLGYATRSDGDDILGSARDHPMAVLAALVGCPQARAIAARGGWSGATSAEAGAFLDVLGAEVSRMVAAAGGHVLTGCEALGATRTDDGWLLRVRRLADGAALALPARSLVIATGGVQAADALQATPLAGLTLGERCGERLVGSHDVLLDGGLARLAHRLDGSASPRIAIIGGGRSAMAAAGLILNSPLGARLGAEALAVLHRRPAAADRCDGFGADWRLRLHAMRPSNERATLELIAAADLVIGAIGYRPVGLPLHDAAGLAIELSCAGGGRSLADGRVLDAAGAPLPNLLGIGLASSGGARRLWQDEAGDIVRQLLPDRAERVRQLVRLADRTSSRAQARAPAL